MHQREAFWIQSDSLMLVSNIVRWQRGEPFAIKAPSTSVPPGESPRGQRRSTILTFLSTLRSTSGAERATMTAPPSKSGAAGAGTFLVSCTFQPVAACAAPLGRRPRLPHLWSPVPALNSCLKSFVASPFFCSSCVLSFDVLSYLPLWILFLVSVRVFLVPSAVGRWLPEVAVTGKALEKSPLGILFAFKVRIK